MQSGDSALSYNAANCVSTPRCRGPAKISDIDETGVTVKCQSQSFEVARCCVGKKKEAQDAWDGAPSAHMGETQKSAGLRLEEGGDLTSSRTVSPKVRSDVN